MASRRATLEATGFRGDETVARGNKTVVRGGILGAGGDGMAAPLIPGGDPLSPDVRRLLAGKAQSSSPFSSPVLDPVVLGV